MTTIDPDQLFIDFDGNGASPEEINRFVRRMLISGYTPIQTESDTEPSDQESDSEQEEVDTSSDQVSE